MYNKLLKLKVPKDKVYHKQLLLEQYMYGCFNSSFKTEVNNFIKKYYK